MSPPLPPTPSWEKDGYRLRPAAVADAEGYYSNNFLPLDPEVVRLTGCQAAFSYQEVLRFFQACERDNTRRDFLLIAPDGAIVGEGVINEIDWTCRSANFRIALFHAKDRGRGLGKWVTETLCAYAFRTLRLRRLTLEVFAFNTRAQALYKRCGFRKDGVLRNAAKDEERPADVFLMSLEAEAWDASSATPEP